MGHDPFHGKVFKTILFDLDDTLYPESCGLARACRTNIHDYMVQRLGIPESMVGDLCNELYSKYGTTMAGLQAVGHHLDYDDWHGFVHGRLPYDTALAPDPALRNLLLTLPQRKFIFTNADTKHAERVMRILGIEDCFEGVICFESIMSFQNNPASRSGYSTPCIQENSAAVSVEGDNTPSTSGAPRPILDGKHSLRRESSLETIKVALRAARTGGKSVEKSLAGLQAALGDGPPSIVCKPQPESYERALRMAGAEPGSTLYFDDSLRNISGGKAAGLATVLVGKTERSEGADLAMEDIHDLPSVLPSLWTIGRAEDAGFQHKNELTSNGGYHPQTLESVRA